MAMTRFRYGLKRDPHDPTRPMHMHLASPLQQPAKTSDLRQNLPGVWDQGNLGSCTAFGGLAAEWALRAKNGQPLWLPSFLATYWNERDIDPLGSVDADTGSSLDILCSALVRRGIMPDSLWPYDVDRFAKQPPLDAMLRATMHRITGFETVQLTGYDLRMALSEGHEVIIGYCVYPSHESDTTLRTGMVPMPGPTEQPLGSHCSLLVGHDDATQLYRVRGSWGANVGQEGHFLFPYDYLQRPDLCFDARILTKEVQL